MTTKIFLGHPVAPAELERAQKQFTQFEWLTPVKGSESTQIADAEIAFGNLSDELLAAAKKMKWLQSPSAGVDRMARHPLFLNGQFFLTTAAGMHESCAQHALALLLSLSRRITAHGKEQVTKRWETRKGLPAPLVLQGVMGVIGLGAIGKRICVMAKALGMKTIGVSHSGKAVPEADEVYPISKLDELLPRLDVITLVVPATTDTDNLLNAARIAKLPKHCIVVNVGRGNAIDENALLSALRENRIAGAALDVFKQEPLPSDSEFFTLPNVVMTPHIGGHRPDYDDRAFEIFIENLKRYTIGQPLKNVVERERGY